jgi:hypothetical protein
MKARHIIQFVDKNGVLSLTAVNRHVPTHERRRVCECAR